MMEQSTIDKINQILPHLSERQRRLYLASEAKALGYGGQNDICEAFHVSATTLRKGREELESGAVLTDDNGKQRVRRAGGGRKPITETQPGILEAVEKLVNPETFGSPENPLRWTTRSLRNIEKELRAEGFSCSHRTVAELLKQLGYSLHINQKMKQVGKESPDRDEQFQMINDRAAAFIDGGEPVVSIDCKKKEHIGPFFNKGAEYTPKKQPTEVLDHDFPLPEEGSAIPFGVLDIYHNEALISVGVDHDTAQFAVNSIRLWWEQMGKERYPDAKHLMITADGGGSNGYRNYLWKAELQKLANETGLEIEVHHYPAGCSKWNRIEHRLLSEISKNWRGRPLESLETIVELIGSTTTETGLSVQCVTDLNEYERGIKVSDEELEAIQLLTFEFHGEWNYIIVPQKPKIAQLRV